MHMDVHCSPVYNSKDLEPTQMPINDRLDKENVVHIHHKILCSHKKRWLYVICIDLDKSENHHSQQTDIRTESQSPHVLTHRWMLNNENTWTQGEEHHTLGAVAGKIVEGQQGVGSWGERAWGQMPDIDEGEEGSKLRCRVCTYATILHVLHMYPQT